MVFSEINTNDKSSELLLVIEKNNKTASDIRNQIKKLKSNCVGESIDLEENISTNCEEVFEEEIDTEEFEDEVAYFLEGYNMLRVDFSKEDLLEVLPSRKNYYFRNILIRFQAEAVREIKEIYEFINEEKDLISLEELEEFKKEVRKIENKKQMLEEVLTVKDSEVEMIEPVRNKIILVPTLAGNVRVIDDIEHIPSEFYPKFLELVNSIIDGTFKGVKRFSKNNYLNGVSEVRGTKVRIIFSRLDKNVYALITAFVKKTDNNKEYQEFLKSRIWEYKGIESSLKAKLTSSEFMENNDFFVEELFNLLVNNEKSKSYKKGGLND